MKTTFAICVVIILSCQNVFGAHNAHIKDVFPLSINNDWKYLYQFSNIDIGNSDGSVQYDSGLVSYVVVDSSSNIDTIFWSIQKKYSLSRTLKTISALVVSQETTFAVVDSSVFTMYELKHDNHPFFIAQGSSIALWPFVSSDCDSTAICRYQIVDSLTNISSVKLKFCYSPTFPYMTYQLTFHPDSGLTSNTASGVLGSHSHSGATISAHLLEKNVILRYHPEGNPILPSNVPILFQNYPNPFNPVTTLSYMIPTRTIVSLRIYNDLGQEIKNFGNSLREPGYYTQIFDASALPSGVYLYRMQTFDLRNHVEQFMVSKKLLLLK